MKKLSLFNTETRSKQEVVPLHGNRLKIYTCGPTVYHFVHIGNLRTFIFEDLLRRTLKFLGNEVFQVMNITDVDDKTIKGAIQNKVSLEEFTNPFTEAFFEDLKTLNIEAAEAYPRATDYIQEMIVIIERLVHEEIAYPSSDGSIYFNIDKFPSYGRLSHLCLSDLRSDNTGRNCADEYDKEKISDFALWKAYDADRDGNIFWESPFGRGRPGWHIECSAMAMQLLGESIDIHAGGIDNMFPHHENEIAQSEAFSKKQFVRHWVHAEHLLVDHKKMSKSLGNFYTLRDLLEKGFTGPEIRFMLIHVHYRTQLNFTFEGLVGCRSSLQRLSDFIARLRSVDGTAAQLAPLLVKARADFEAALADDLNISAALAVLFEMIREINTLCDSGKVSKHEAAEVLQLLEKWEEVLGFIPLKEDEIPLDLEEALVKREEARKQKNWKVADEMRDLIHARGYQIDDTKAGARLKRVKV